MIGMRQSGNRPSVFQTSRPHHDDSLAINGDECFDMKCNPVLAAVGVTMIAASQAAAVTLTNRDDNPYRLEVIYSEDSASVDKFKVGANESIDDICLEGCVIRLSNGEETEFLGSEKGEIRGGRFVLFELPGTAKLP